MSNNNVISQETNDKSVVKNKKMKNKQNKNVEVSQIKASMSEVEYRDFELDKMRYFDNKLSYKLGYLGIFTSLITGFIGLNTISPSYFLGGFGTVLCILMNIFILLAAFLAVERVKVYSEGYSKFITGLGVVCFLRIFWYPLSTIILYKRIMDAAAAGSTWSSIQSTYADTLGNSFLAGTAVYDSDGIITSIKTNGFLIANGYVRAIVMIVLLLITSGAFIASGLIGYIKGKKLHAYINKIEKKDNKD